MSTSIHSKNEADNKKWGLITNHAYSLIQAAEVKKNG
jgi:hypothetical protein